MNSQSIVSHRHVSARQTTSIVIGFLCALTILHASDAPADAASLSRSVKVAHAAFAGVYDAGLAALKTRFAH